MTDVRRAGPAEAPCSKRRTAYLPPRRAAFYAFFGVGAHGAVGRPRPRDPFIAPFTLTEDGERAGRDVTVVGRGDRVLNRPDLGPRQSIRRGAATGRLIVGRTRGLAPAPGMEPTRRNRRTAGNGRCSRALSTARRIRLLARPSGRRAPVSRDPNVRSRPSGRRSNAVSFRTRRRSLRVFCLSAGSVRSGTSRQTTTVGVAFSHPRAVQRGTPRRWRGSRRRFVERAPEAARLSFHGGSLLGGRSPWRNALSAGGCARPPRECALTRSGPVLIASACLCGRLTRAVVKTHNSGVAHLRADVHVRPSVGRRAT